MISTLIRWTDCGNQGHHAYSPSGLWTALLDLALRRSTGTAEALFPQCRAYSPHTQSHYWKQSDGITVLERCMASLYDFRRWCTALPFNHCNHLLERSVRSCERKQGSPIYPFVACAYRWTHNSIQRAPIAWTVSDGLLSFSTHGSLEAKPSPSRGIRCVTSNNVLQFCAEWLTLA